MQTTTSLHLYTSTPLHTAFTTAPNFVEKLSPEWKAKFVDPSTSLAQVEEYLQQIRSIGAATDR